MANMAHKIVYELCPFMDQKRGFSKILINLDDLWYTNIVFIDKFWFDYGHHGPQNMSEW